jgi:hypothetical protein
MDELKKLMADFKEMMTSKTSPGGLFNIMKELDEGSSSIVKTFGQGKEAIEGMRASMAAAATSVELLGGNLSNVVAIQKEVATELGRNVVLNEKSYEGLYAASLVSNKTATEIVSAFKDAGMSAYQASTQIQTVLDSAREVGVNAEAVSREVLNNTNLLNRYNFAGGVEGLSKMAAQAVSLRINIKDIENFSSKVFNPDGAIEMAAAMQRLGVAQSDLLDPLRLMDLSANDPTELQNQIVQMTSQFVQLNKKGQFEIMPGAKRQLAEIAKEMNIPYETITKMALGSAELDEKMSKIKFPKDAVSDDQRKLIANLAEMNKAGNGFEVTFNDPNTNMLITKDISLLSKEDIDQLTKAGESKPIEKLAEGQLSMLTSINAIQAAILNQLTYGVAGSKLGQDIYQLPGRLAKDVGRPLVTKSRSGQISQGINQNINPVIEELKKTIVTGAPLSSVLFKLGEAGRAAATGLGSFVTEAKHGYKEQSQEMILSKNKLEEIIGLSIDKYVGGTTQQGQDYIQTPEGRTSFLPQDGLIVTTQFEQLSNFIERVNSMNTGNLNGIGQAQQPSSTNHSMDVNFNLKVDSNHPLDVNHLENIFNNNTGIKEKIIEIATLGMQRFSPESSDRKKMNPYV